MPRFAAGERELSIRAYGSGEHGLGEESGSTSTLEEIQFDCEAARERSRCGDDTLMEGDSYALQEVSVWLMLSFVWLIYQLSSDYVR